MPGTTPDHAITFMQATDPLAQVAAIMETLAQRVGFLLPRDLTKTLDESVTNSAALQNDDTFQFAAVSGEIYDIDLYLIVLSAANAAGDIKTAWTHPGGAFHQFAQGPDISLASGSISNAVELRVTRNVASGSMLDAFGCSTQRLMVKLHCHYEASASGTVRFQWAQNVANANATTVCAGSHMAVRRKLA